MTVYVDKRMSFGAFKNCLVPYVGVSSEYFRVSEEDYDWSSVLLPAIRDDGSVRSEPFVNRSCLELLLLLSEARLRFKPTSYTSAHVTSSQLTWRLRNSRLQMNLLHVHEDVKIRIPTAILCKKPKTKFEKKTERIQRPIGFIARKWAYVRTPLFTAEMVGCSESEFFLVVCYLTSSSRN